MIGERKKCIEYLIQAKDWKYRVEQVKNVRTIPQNRYYWGVMMPILCDHFWYTPEEMHSALKIHFLVDVSGKLPIIKSTKKITTSDFIKYVESIQRWAAQDYGLYIPDPNEIYS